MTCRLRTWSRAVLGVGALFVLWTTALAAGPSALDLAARSIRAVDDSPAAVARIPARNDGVDRRPATPLGGSPALSEGAATEPFRERSVAAPRTARRLIAEQRPRRLSFPYDAIAPPDGL